MSPPRDSPGDLGANKRAHVPTIMLWLKTDTVPALRHVMPKDPRHKALKVTAPDGASSLAADQAMA